MSELPREQSVEEKKREMFQIVPDTRLSSDYMNEISPFWYLMKLQGIEAAILALREHPVRNYIERFPMEKYPEVINKKNEDSIRILSEIVEIFNKQVQDGLLTENSFTDTYEKIYKIVIGEKLKKN